MKETELTFEKDNREYHVVYESDGHEEVHLCGFSTYPDMVPILEREKARELEEYFLSNYFSEATTHVASSIADKNT